VEAGHGVTPEGGISRSAAHTPTSPTSPTCPTCPTRPLSMRILFAGIIARYPFGGVTWCSLMYLLGLRALGHEVFYVEDTGECVYDPVLNTRSLDPSYGTHYIHQSLEPYGFGDRWSFVNYDGGYHGRSADEVRRFAAEADLFINLSGGSWFW